MRSLFLMSLAAEGGLALDFGDCLGTMLQVPPSVASPELPVPGPILMNGADFDGDTPHVISNAPSKYHHLIVHLAGTTDSPTKASCLIASAAASGAPTIGLSFQWVPLPDGSRNAACADAYLNAPAPSVAIAACIEDSHTQTIWGGDLQPQLWPATSADASISGRLVALLNYLAVTYPQQGWGTYVDEDGAPYWGRIFVSGHSQGGGHAAYLASQYALAGAAIVSAPQDSGDAWLDEPFATHSLAVAYHSLEPSAALIAANWKRMAATGTIVSATPDAGGATATGYTGPVDACRPSPLSSSAEPSNNTGCTGREGFPIYHHCGMGTDERTPETGDPSTALYAIELWPALFAAASTSLACNGCPTSCFTPARLLLFGSSFAECDGC